MFKVFIFWLLFIAMIVNTYISLKFAFSSIKDVTRFISTTTPEDDKFDVDSALKSRILSYQLE
jgi:hypothetical protein